MVINKDSTLLYHGSSVNLNVGDYLLPSVSFDYKPYVYATDDPAYALVRCGNFDIGDFTIKEEYSGADEKFNLIELCSGGFQCVFDTPGYVYLVKKSDFEFNGTEYVSCNPVKIIYKIPVENVFDEMISDEFIDRYRFVPEFRMYDYFTRNGIDVEEYFKRRRTRFRKLKEAREVSSNG